MKQHSIWVLFGAILSASALFAPLAVARDGDRDDWRSCADEGQTCRVQGRAVVRYGEPGRWNTRAVDGPVNCNNDTFGDPAPGVPKRCEARGGNAAPPVAGGWRYCAAEGELCRVPGRAQVRFGEGRRYAMRNVAGDVNCSNKIFGDPAPGVVKHCEVQGGGVDNAGAGGWRRCAGEGQRCSFNGGAEVRYGADGRYVYRDGRNGLNCNNEQFGSDPYEGRVKSCDIRR